MRESLAGSGSRRRLRGIGAIMRRNYALFGLIASASLVLMGAVILLVLTADGTMRFQGVVYGAGLGFWLELAYLGGRAVYGRRKNVWGLGFFMAGALMVGLFYHFKWQLPYMNAHRDVICLLEQLSGMIWSLALTGVYLFGQDFKKAEG